MTVLIAVGTTPYNKAMAPVNFQAFQRIFENCLDIRRSGSAALDIAYTACGRQDGYFERDLKPVGLFRRGCHSFGSRRDNDRI